MITSAPISPFPQIMIQKNTAKKNWVILEIVRDFLHCYVQFMSIYEKYKKNTLKFEDLNKFINDKDPSLPLFNLKESCHILFRYQGEQSCRDEEKLLDLAVGSIFHEAMKIRENLYQLEVYRPRYMQILNRFETSKHERNLLLEFKKIGTRAERRLAESMVEAKRLFQDTLKQLADLLPAYKENTVLIRFLLRNKDLVQKAFGKRKGMEVIADIFPGGLGEAYEVVGRSYLKSEYYDIAAEFFRKALKYKSRDKSLKGLFLYAHGMDGYYRNSYKKSLQSFHQLLPVINGLKKDNGYLERVEEVCRKIGREFLEDKKRKLAYIAFQLADEIRKSLATG